MADDLRNTGALEPPTLQVVPRGTHVSPSVPIKRIYDGEDLSFFLRSKAYVDIMTFLLQLNRAMVPERNREDPGNVIAWPLSTPDIHLPTNVTKLRSLVHSLKSLMKHAPPETGPRRFGNAAFRTWFAAVQEAMPGLLREAIPDVVWEHVAGGTARQTLEKELESYLLGSFGSSERLDYGTGHELSFLAFLGCIWKLGGFDNAAPPGVEERAIVIGIIQPYLELVRNLILTYTLEPAGSHGVWGLDDHSFLSYVFGSAQYSPPIEPGTILPTEGSLKGVPTPDKFVKREFVEQYRSTNLFFSAIGFIFDVKTGPFWEHSPTLYDISGIKSGWAKINKGMIKMYNAEVLSKFPVVQHFPFGTLFSWEAHPHAVAPTTTPHVGAQPQKTAMPASGIAQSSGRVSSNLASNAVANPRVGTTRPMAGTTLPAEGTTAPWARPSATTARTVQSQTRYVAPSTRAPARPFTDASHPQPAPSSPRNLYPPQ